jgi:type VI secretion system protein ImpA
MVDLEVLLSEAGESPPCGQNLEHDLSFFELEEAARGKPEQRVGDAVKAGEDPRWPQVVELAQGLLLRTKDLRVAVYLTRALTRTEGITGLARGLGLIAGLLERYWDHIHPVLEHDHGDDPTERVNALASLADPEAVVSDLRSTHLVSSREHGQLQAREVELALGRLASPQGAGTSKPLNEIHAQIAAAFANDRAIPSALREARERVVSIQTLVADRVGSARAIDLKPLVQSLENLIETCDAALGTRPTAAGAAAPGQSTGEMHPAIDGEIRSREQAVRILDFVCRYLEQHEPSNPAPLFIRRAQRLISKNFIEIMTDLVPDSLPQLERLAGALDKK